MKKLNFIGTKLILAFIFLYCTGKATKPIDCTDSWGCPKIISMIDFGAILNMG